MKLNELIAWYENLTPARLPEIGGLYQETATFRDPFNHVAGQAAIAGIFRHMFETTGQPRFEIIDKVRDGNLAWLRWKFHFELKGRSVLIEGASRLVFGEDGRVEEHRDYWDAADLFIQLPMLGTMVRHLKQRLSAPMSSVRKENNKNER